jgi:hypothetical protein
MPDATRSQHPKPRDAVRTCFVGEGNCRNKGWFLETAMSADARRRNRRAYSTFPVLVYPLRVTFTRAFSLTALIGASTLLHARQKPPFSGVCAHANQLITAAMSSIASEEDADEEEEHDALPVFRPSSPGCAPGPIAVPGAAQLLIPLPSPLSGRGLALP